MCSSHLKSENLPQSGTDDWRQFGKYRGRILHREPIADHMNLYVVEKPENFTFRPGQAVELSLDQPGWRDSKRPFTITSLPSNPRLEFMIKSYPTDTHPQHGGMTERLETHAGIGERIIFGDAWGAIEYRGPGVFIAGGAGMTPFVAILRMLEQEKRLDGNRLFFSNRYVKDVFLQGELFRCLGHRIVCTLTREQHRDYECGRIDREWLEKRVDRFDQPFYVCGPPAMVEELTEVLRSLGADPQSIVCEDD